MPTRIYLTYGIAAALIPPLDDAWERKYSIRSECGVARKETDFQEISGYKSTSTNPYDIGLVQFISGPLQAQTISGTVKGQILARQDVGGNFGVAMVIKVLNAAGAPRGTLLSYFPAVIGTELSITATNRHFPPAETALTELAIHDGDRLVIELGFRCYNVPSTIYDVFITVGDGAATDLPEDETEIDYLNPWIEFSGGLVWSVEDAYTPVGYLKLCGSGTVALADEVASDYAADGCMQIVGAGVLDAPLLTAFISDGSFVLSSAGVLSAPPEAGYSAAGFMSLSGVGILDSMLPADYSAAGLMFLFGPCVLDQPQDIIRVFEYKAGGSFQILGPCALASVLRQVSAFMAGGHYLLPGGCALGIGEVLVAAYAAAGCYDLSAPCRSKVQGPVYAYAANTTTGPVLQITSQAQVGFIYPQVTNLVADGCYILGGAEIPADGVFETLVLTGARSELSLYSNFKFNSYAKYGGKYYGATEEGIFLLEGDDDAGDKIHTGARIGPTNFGTDREKRLRLVRCGGDCSEAQVRVSDEHGKTALSSVRNGRADVSREVQGREITLEIAGFKTLTHLEITPLVLAKR